MAGLVMPCQNLRFSTFRGTQLQLPNNRLCMQQTRLVPQIEAAQVLQGKVVSIAADKSAVVAVDTFRPHPIYKRRIRTTKKYIVHDEDNKAAVGDVVEMIPCKPISKRKRFVLGETVQAAQ